MLLHFSPHLTVWPMHSGLHRRDFLRFTKATKVRFVQKIQTLKGLVYDRKVERISARREEFQGREKCADESRSS